MGKVYELYGKTESMAHALKQCSAIVLTPSRADGCVGVFLGLSERNAREPDWNPQNWNPQTIDLPRAALLATISKLAPAIDAMFRKALAAEIEALRLNAIDELEGELRKLTAASNDE